MTRTHLALGVIAAALLAVLGWGMFGGTRTPAPPASTISSAPRAPVDPGSASSSTAPPAAPSTSPTPTSDSGEAAVRGFVQALYTYGWGDESQRTRLQNASVFATDTLTAAYTEGAEAPDKDFERLRNSRSRQVTEVFEVSQLEPGSFLVLAHSRIESDGTLTSTSVTRAYRVGVERVGGEVKVSSIEPN